MGQWNEWAINSGQWAARVAPLKSHGSSERPLFACAAPELPNNLAIPLLSGRPVSGPEGRCPAALGAGAGTLSREGARGRWRHAFGVRGARCLKRAR